MVACTPHAKMFCFSAEAKVMAPALHRAGRPAKTVVAGGNPWQLFFNERQRAAKALATPAELTTSGALKPEVRAAVTRACSKEWAAMPAESKAQWGELFQIRREERKREAADVALSKQEDCTQKHAPLSHWGLGTHGSVLHPQTVAAYFESGGKLPTAQEVFDPDEFRVPAKETRTPLQGEGLVVLGCPMRGRNMCEGDPDAPAINRICRALSGLTKALGKVRAKSGDSLVLCEGPRLRIGVPRPRARLFLLLTEPVYKPVYQDFTWCEALRHDIGGEHLAFPFTVEVKAAEVSLDIDGEPAATGARHLSSVQAAKEMLARAEDWSFRLLDYTILSAVQMSVTGFGEDLVAPPPREARKAGPSRDLLDLLGSIDDLDTDPLAPAPAQARDNRRSRRPQPGQHRHGGEQSAPPAAVADEAPRPAGQADLDEWAPFDPGEEMVAYEELSEEPHTMDADMLRLGAAELDQPSQLHRASFDEPADAAAHEGDAFGAGVSDDTLAQGVSVAGEIADVLVEANSVGDAELAQSADRDQPNPEQHEAALVAPVEAPADPLQPPAGARIVEGQPQGWSITALGYVFNAEHRQVGRITRWGASVSCKCTVNSHAHGGKCSLAKSQRQATDGQLMQWLALGEARLQQASPGVAKIDLAERHRTLWSEVLRGDDGGAPR